MLNGTVELVKTEKKILSRSVLMYTYSRIVIHRVKFVQFITIFSTGFPYFLLVRKNIQIIIRDILPNCDFHYTLNAIVLKLQAIYSTVIISK